MTIPTMNASVEDEEWTLEKLRNVPGISLVYWSSSEDFDGPYLQGVPFGVPDGIYGALLEEIQKESETLSLENDIDSSEK
jgi:hypothetical protein